jgi:hypothetical protein
MMTTDNYDGEPLPSSVLARSWQAALLLGVLTVILGSL